MNRTSATGMQLFPEQLAEAVTCLRRDFRDRLDHERRVLPRFRVWAPIALRPLTPSNVQTDALTVWIRDLSRGGIGIMYTKPLDASARFLIDLPRFDSTARTLICTVVYCKGAGHDMYSVGARFDEEWTETIEAPAGVMIEQPGVLVATAV